MLLAPPRNLENSTTVKVRLQTQATPTTSVRQQDFVANQQQQQTRAATTRRADKLYYRNAVHAFVRISREEGVSPLRNAPQRPSPPPADEISNRSRACTKEWSVRLASSRPLSCTLKLIA